MSSESNQSFHDCWSHVDQSWYILYITNLQEILERNFQRNFRLCLVEVSECFKYQICFTVLSRGQILNCMFMFTISWQFNITWMFRPSWCIHGPSSITGVLDKSTTCWTPEMLTHIIFKKFFSLWKRFTLMSFRTKSKQKPQINHFIIFWAKIPSVHRRVLFCQKLDNATAG